jgi:hypothetical protein
MDDARKAGIAGNPAYAKYPRQMLLARASAELVRQMCPDVTGGIVMFAEEAADADAADLTPTGPPMAAVKPPATSKRSRAAKTPPPTETPTDEPAAVDDKPSEAQTRMAMAAFADVGIHDRDDRIAATSALIDRKVESWNDLNRNEASTVIDGLERVKAGGISWHITDNHIWRILHNDDPELLDETES